jgi:hypothetical protein
MLKDVGENWQICILLTHISPHFYQKPKFLPEDDEKLFQKFHRVIFYADSENWIENLIRFN